MAVLDGYWREAAEFTARHARDPGVVVLAPADMLASLPNAVVPEAWRGARQPDAVVIHKGEIERIGTDRIRQMTAGLHPGFANEVFVVFTGGGTPRFAETSPHVVAFRERMDAAAKAEASAVSAGRLAPVRQGFYLGNNRAITTTVHGQKIFLDTRDISLTPHLLIDGFWESWLTEALKTVLKPGMHFVDIGANAGYFSLMAAGIVGREGRVTAFEPHPTLAELVHSSFSVNGFLDRAAVAATAVGPSAGTATLHALQRFMASSSLIDTSPMAGQLADSVSRIEVPVTSLDLHFAEGTLIDVVKIDAEGSEPGIIEGAARVLRDNPGIRIFMEFSPVLLRSGGHSPAAFFASIRERGFRIFRVCHDGGLEEQHDAGALPWDDHWDVLLMR